MFYSFEILERRGKFGVVWLAATKATKLNKKDYSRVNVRRTCDDIINVIELKAQPVKSRGSKPRYSLYLSAQLMYGVVCVYEKQCGYLIGEVQRLYERFHQTRHLLPADTTKIDLQPNAIRPAEFCTMPDPLVIQHSDLEPNFGAIVRTQDITSIVLDPYSLPDVEPLLMSPPPRASTSSAESPEQQMLAALGSPHTVSRRSDIRLKEKSLPEQPDVHGLIPGEKDLIPLDSFEMVAEAAIGLEALLSPLHSSAAEQEAAQPVGSTPIPADEDVWVIHPQTGDVVLSSSLSPMSGILPTERKRAETERHKAKRRPRVSAIPEDTETAKIRRVGDLSEIILEDIAEEPPVDAPASGVDVSAPATSTLHMDVSAPGTSTQHVDVSALDTDVPAPALEVCAVPIEVTSPQAVAKPTEVDLVTPTPAAVKRRLHLLELSPLEETQASPSRRKKAKKARRLVFADTSIQITKDELRANFQTSSELCREPAFPQINRPPSARQLFEQPGRQRLSQPLLNLWQRNSQTLEEETPSTDEERAIWSVAYRHPKFSPAKETSTTESELEDTIEQARKVRESSHGSPEGLREVSIGSAEATVLEVTPASLSESDLVQAYRE
ncbi:meiotic recombination protein REC8 homolog isoform X2 [Ptychodera flava]|uniref:meiotic recombination protein REC8 homolog isoform X2 n=1 Tax=Ptychodera flava TaxID=63121 RepID=UPI00396AA987